MKFRGNLSSGNQFFPCGQTNRHDEDNTRA